jgi:flavin-dependent thymidylate synthase
MYAYCPIHSQQNNLPIWVSQMRRNSLRIAPVSAIPATSSIQRHQRSLYDILLNTHTGVPWKWSQPVSKLPQPETLPDKYSRHRSFSFQEFSQRYADPTQDLSFVVRAARKQDPKNRQNSVELEATLGDQNLQEQWAHKQRELIDLAKSTYQWAVNNGIAKEQARAVLPEGNTVSRLYMNGTLRSWVHFIELRSGNGTQKEHQEIAVACAKVIAEVFPMAETLISKE